MVVSLVYFAFLFCLPAVSAETADIHAYGPYEMNFTLATIEGNQKLKTFYELKPTITQHDNGTISIYLNVKFKKYMGVIGMKYQAFVWSDQLKKYMLSMNLGFKNLCATQFARMFVAFIPDIDADCKIKPGEYNVSIPNLNQFYHIIFSDNFVYGQYRVVSDIFIAGHGRFLRTITAFVVYPLGKSKQKKM